MKIKELREKKGVSQREMANALGLFPQAISRYEKGDGEPNIEIILKLADYFHVSVDELLGRPTSIVNKMALTPRARSIIEKVIGMTDKQQELTEFYIDTMLGSM